MKKGWDLAHITNIAEEATDIDPEVARFLKLEADDTLNKLASDTEPEPAHAPAAHAP